ncbi:Calmodulin-regulated spectrin-associated protein 1 [Hondaea fermentalgiana]|uniref:Calmodulin-regulated spectrin-associated protein 1 n=1 Tax=Hondaea fermentalgiana TaxID=2315210 RepID=A0A2R5GEJ3_9STRA|nr:Calmodulin-regulated spectrin-associated protein 1 [Hondaea fermentalgiana]|eukprot:GBG26234.1 Calmodulin-regulated spectrin-associated protein 1 [Hondaea fermentalgiana]
MKSDSSPASSGSSLQGTHEGLLCCQAASVILGGKGVLHARKEASATVSSDRALDYYLQTAPRAQTQSVRLVRDRPCQTAEDVLETLYRFTGTRYQKLLPVVVLFSGLSHAALVYLPSDHPKTRKAIVFEPQTMATAKHGTASTKSLFADVNQDAHFGGMPRMNCKNKEISSFNGSVKWKKNKSASASVNVNVNFASKKKGNVNVNAECKSKENSSFDGSVKWKKNKSANVSVNSVLRKKSKSVNANFVSKKKDKGSTNVICKSKENSSFEGSVKWRKNTNANVSVNSVLRKKSKNVNANFVSKKKDKGSMNRVADEKELPERQHRLKEEEEAEVALGRQIQCQSEEEDAREPERIVQAQDDDDDEEEEEALESQRRHSEEKHDLHRREALENAEKQKRLDKIATLARERKLKEKADRENHEREVQRAWVRQIEQEKARNAEMPPEPNTMPAMSMSAMSEDSPSKDPKDVNLRDFAMERIEELRKLREEADRKYRAALAYENSRSETPKATMSPVRDIRFGATEDGDQEAAIETAKSVASAKVPWNPDRGLCPSLQQEVDLGSPKSNVDNASVRSPRSAALESAAYQEVPADMDGWSDFSEGSTSVIAPDSPRELSPISSTSSVVSDGHGGAFDENDSGSQELDDEAAGHEERPRPRPPQEKLFSIEIPLNGDDAENIRRQRRFEEVRRRKLAESEAPHVRSGHAPVVCEIPPEIPPTIEIATKSNLKLIMNAITHVCLAGAHHAQRRERVLGGLEERAASGEPEFTNAQYVILFRNEVALKFRGVYVVDRVTRDLRKVQGAKQLPAVVDAAMVDSFYKYNTGQKRFSRISTKSITKTTDAVALNPKFFPLPQRM